MRGILEGSPNSLYLVKGWNSFDPLRVHTCSKCPGKDGRGNRYINERWKICQGSMGLALATSKMSVASVVFTPHSNIPYRGWTYYRRTETLWLMDSEQLEIKRFPL